MIKLVGCSLALLCLLGCATPTLLERSHYYDQDYATISRDQLRQNHYQTVIGVKKVTGSYTRGSDWFDDLFNDYQGRHLAIDRELRRRGIEPNCGY